LTVTETYTEETQLVASLIKKDKAAFEYLYDNYKAALFGVISRMIQPDEAAEDVLQDVFIKIYHNIEKFDASKGRLYTWLLNVTRNYCIDKIRSSDQKNQNKNRSIDDLVPVINNQLFTGISVDHIGLRKLVNSLVPEQREIIERMYFEGYTQTEVAEIMNIPLGTVKTRARAAILKLRTLFDTP
jgi:RNA polymerase sigma-70 factor, ECF subfamily